MKILMLSLIIISLACPGKCEEETNDYYDHIADNSDNDLLNQLVNDCNAPIKYLERRGYLQKGKVKPIKIQHETSSRDDDPKYKKNFFYFPKQGHLNDRFKSKKSSYRDAPEKFEIQKTAKVFVDTQESPENKGSSTNLIEKLNNGATAAVADGNEKVFRTTVEEKDNSLEESEPESSPESKDVKADNTKDDPGFFKKVKHKIYNLFAGDKKLVDASSVDDAYMDDDNSYLDETFSGLYSDDSGLEDDESGMYNDFLMPDFPNARMIRSDPFGSNAGPERTTEHLLTGVGAEKGADTYCSNNTSNNIGEPLFLDDNTDNSTSHLPSNNRSSSVTNSTSQHPSNNSTTAANNTSSSTGTNTTSQSSGDNSKISLSDDELFKNLSEIDVAYVKGFVHCYLENKKKFITDILRSANLSSSAKESTTPPKDNTNSTAKPEESAKNTTTNVNVTAIDQSPSNSSTTAVSANRTTVTNSTTPMPSTATDKPKQQGSSSTVSPSSSTTGTSIVELSTRPPTMVEPRPESSSGMGKAPQNFSEGMEDCLVTERRKFDTKLQFMAHLHHQVDEVGKPPHKPLDLKKIEDMIESSKHLTAGAKSAVLGNDQTTQCSPLQLNDLSIDMEWNELGDSPKPAKTSKRTSVKARNAMNDVFQNAGKVNSRVSNDDSTLYLDLDENDNKQAPKKREAGGYRRNSDRKMNKVLSDITSSLNKFKSRKRAPKFSSSSYSDDDLSSLDSSDEEYEYSEKPSEDDDDGWASAGSSSQQQKKTSRRKASKPKNKKSDKAVDDRKAELTKEAKVDPGEDMNPFHHFSELKDIQFKVNPDQEQDISKFIENLNTPPEIFSFDVEKYIKPEVEFESAHDFGVEEPKRQYYEFIETPNVDSMNVPLIPPTYQEADSNLKLLNKKGDGGNSPVNKRSEKRDLLRQYIKGVSNQLIGQNLPFVSEEVKSSPVDVQSNDIPLTSNNFDQEAQLKENRNAERDRETIASRTKALIENYAVNLDAMNFVKYGSHDKSSDDFIDNYYLLNDGSYKKEDPSASHPKPYSSYDNEIDRDLDRKFSELNMAKSGGDPNTQSYPILRNPKEGERLLTEEDRVDQPPGIL